MAPEPLSIGRHPCRARREHSQNDAAIFDSDGMRPAVGSEFLRSRHLPDEIHDHFIYGCVINMHGLPRFTVRDEDSGAGLTGERIADLLDSTDKMFRPVDPHVGPDGAIWFGDWCNPLIGHMQYSQRDPNRDHDHGRIYRLVNTERPLLQPQTQRGKSIEQLLDQLSAYELRTRCRARRELRDHDEAEVLSAVDRWLESTTIRDRCAKRCGCKRVFVVSIRRCYGASCKRRLSRPQRCGECRGQFLVADSGSASAVSRRGS